MKPSDLKDHKTHPKGSVLVFALWVVVVLSLFAIALSGQIRHKINTFQHFETKEELRWTAEAGALQTVMRLAAREKGTFTLKDAVSYSISGSLGRGSYKVEAPFTTTGGQRDELVCAIMDENRKINVNTADPSVLSTLFAEIGELGDEAAERLAYAVKDFIDEDDHVSRYYESGSEKYAYQAIGLFEGPKNAPFECLSELLYVKGMTRDVFEKIQGYVTVYGSGGVNLNTVELPALIVLGVDQVVADAVIGLRLGPDGRAGTDDDHVFEDIGSLFNDVRGHYPEMTDSEAYGLNFLVQQGLLTVDSDHFSFISEASVGGGRKKMRVACVYSHEDGVRYWAEI